MYKKSTTTKYKWKKKSKLSCPLNRKKNIYIIVFYKNIKNLVHIYYKLAKKQLKCHDNVTTRVY